jgi:hypothetical protein
MSGLDDVLERLVNEPTFRDRLYDDPAGALAGYELSADDLEMLATTVDGNSTETGVETRTSKSTLTAMFSELFGLFGAQTGGTGAPETMAGHMKGGTDAFAPGTADVGGSHSHGGLLGMLDDVEPGGGGGDVPPVDHDMNAVADLFGQGGGGGGNQGGMIDLFDQPGGGGGAGNDPGGMVGMVEGGGTGGGGGDGAGGVLGALDDTGGGGGSDTGGVIGETGDALVPDGPGGGGGGGGLPDGAGGGGEPEPYIYTPGEGGGGGGGGIGGDGTVDMPVDPSDPSIGGGGGSEVPAVQVPDGEVPAVQLPDEAVGDPGAVSPPEPDLIADLGEQLGDGSV